MATGLDPRVTHAPSHKGLRELFSYPLMSAIFERRTRRVARGTSIPSGPISYTSPNKPAPLTPLEEAVLIVSTGLTGAVTMHDVPARNADGSDRFSAPLINVLARSASSIDNAHAVSFFLILSGYWLRATGCRLEATGSRPGPESEVRSPEPVTGA